MSWPRHPVRLHWLAAVVGVSACSLVADFSGLDDAPRGAPGGAGASPGGAGDGGAVASSVSTGGGGAALAGGAGGQGGDGEGGEGGVGGVGGVGGAGGAPACKEAVEPCTNKTECCGNLACGDTSAGHVCCGLTGEPCTKPGGEDCCGWFSECVDDFCT